MTSVMSNEQQPEEQNTQEKRTAAASELARSIWEYVQVVGWLAQMDPTYPHTEFHPYEATGPMPEPTVV